MEEGKDEEETEEERWTVVVVVEETVVVVVVYDVERPVERKGECEEAVDSKEEVGKRRWVEEAVPLKGDAATWADVRETEEDIGNLFLFLMGDAVVIAVERTL